MDVQALVAVSGEEEAARRLPVAARAAGLLVVGLERLGDGRMADGSYVSLVDAHPEGVRRDDDVHLAVHEAPLRFGALLALEAGMVGRNGTPETSREKARERVAARARARVDDRRPGGRVGEDRCDAPLAVGIVRRSHDDVGEVRAIESSGHEKRVAQAQPRGDVARHERRGGSCAGEDLLRGERVGSLRQVEVVGTKVMPPLRDTVRLVNDEAGDAYAGEGLDEAARREALRRDVEEADIPSPNSRQGLAIVGKILLGVDQRGVLR